MLADVPGTKRYHVFYLSTSAVLQTQTMSQVVVGGRTDAHVPAVLLRLSGFTVFRLCLRQIKLPLGKELQCQPLPAQMLPAHLAAMAAAAAAMSGSITHRTGHATSPAPSPALFQTQTLSAALLRPAPGPIRTSHPQVLFSPY